MTSATLDHLTERLELADDLLAGRNRMLEPQDLPGRYGRVIKAIDRLLSVVECEAVLGGGWAVWRHGFEGRMTQADRVEEFLRVAGVAGFEVLPQPAGRWPKLIHEETGIKVDVRPQGQRPGTSSKPAPTTLPHPSSAGARGTNLRYIRLATLVELKLAAGRARDESDVIELIRANPGEVDTIARHLDGVHPDYRTAFDRLVTRAREQEDH